MFFSTEVLGRKGRFALVWKIGTSTDKLGRVKRSLILEYDVRAGVEDLLRALPTATSGGERKFSLYLSAQLTHGLVKILSRQSDALIEDMRAALTLLTKPPPPTSLPPPPTPKPKGKERQQLTLPSHDESRATGPIYANPGRETQNNFLEGLEGLNQVTDDIAASTTDADPSTEVALNLLLAVTGPNQAHNEDITMPPPPQPELLNQMFEDELPPCSDHFTQIAPQPDEGFTPLSQTPIQISAAATPGQPNAPSHASNPSSGESAERTQLPDSQEDRPNLPSLVLHLDTLTESQIHHQPPAKRARATANHSRHPRQPPPQPARQQPATQMKANVDDFSDIVFASEADRTAKMAAEERRKAREAEVKAFFHADAYLPIQTRMCGLESGRGEAGALWAPALLRRFRQLAGADLRGEAPLRLQDLDEIRPRQRNPLLDHQSSLSSEQLEQQQQPTETELEMARAMENNETAASNFLRQQNRPSSVLAQPAEMTALDGGVWPMEEEPAMEVTPIAVGPKAGEPATFLRAMEAIQAERSGSAQTAPVAFTELFPPETTTTATAAVQFYNLLRLAKDKVVSVTQDEAYAAIFVQSFAP